jgi:lipid II:glycine glycyltransferase (peptidoglycan interpeptide bridge formation enzyme)
MTLEPLPLGEPLIACEDFLQCDFWGAFKAAFGWKPYRYRMSIAAGKPLPDQTGLLALVRRFPFGLSFAYVAHGPYIDASGGRADGESLSLEYADNRSSSDWGAEPQRNFSEKLLDIAAELRKDLPSQCFFIRFDLPQYRETSAPQILPDPFRKSASDVQPPDTVIVDLRPEENGILAAMKPKWRYNVKLAEKKGVAIGYIASRGSSATQIDAGIDLFYEIYRETAARDKIALHGRDYYRALFDAASKDTASHEVRLYCATHSGKTLAAIIVLIGKKQAVYLYGASSNESRNLMPAYALQWRAMRDAKASGCESYDLFGIPPNDDPAHPMHGLYRFKTGFGGKIIHRLGCWDYPLKPFPYALFRCAEGLRAFWFKKVMKLGRAGKAKAEKGNAKPEE